MLEQEVKQKIHEYEGYVLETRKYLHENPEVSLQEFETSKFLKQEVQKLGIEIVEIEGTGFIGVLDTGKEGKTIALRTDIDALPIVEHENNLKGKRTMISKNVGAMHACGHDGHMTTLLTTAKVLSGLKDQLTGKILFLFESAEENGGGIEQMLEGMKQFKIDAVYGNHVLCYMDDGKFCISQGPRMAGAILIDFKVKGRGGHGSRPDLAINPLFALVNILSNVTSAWANQVDVTKTVTLGITQINCGTAPNVIADEAHCTGTLRYFDVEEGDKARKVFIKIAKLVAEAHNCTVEFHDRMLNDTGIPVMNDPKLSAMVRQTANKVVGEENLVEDYTWFASESFARYAKFYPAHFTFIGIKNEEYGSGADQHNEHFDFDSRVLLNAANLMTQFTIDFLG